MSLIGNLIWIIFGGLFVFIEYVVAGFVMCLTIIGIPWGIQSFKLAFANLAPFGKNFEQTNADSPALNLLLNVIWLVIGGFWIAVTHLILGLVFCITIIGIPFGIQHFKLMRLSFTPFGYDLR